MEKFDEWNEVKKQTSKKKRTVYIKPREIFWVKIGQNIGDEEFGKGKDFLRPVIVVRLLSKLGMVNKNDFEALKDKLKKAIDPIY